jgi:hypothetical protein
MVLHAGFQKPVETGWFSRKPGKAIQPYFTELGFGEKTNICTVANVFGWFSAWFLRNWFVRVFLTLSECTFLNFELISKYF